MGADDKRRHLLTLLYEWKTSVEHERAITKQKLDAALDEACKGTQFTRQDLKDYLMATHYKEFYVKRKQAENAGMV